MRNEMYLKAGRNSESDECLTPRYAIEPIVKYLKQKNYKRILCPFDKASSFYVRVLEANDFDVTYSHKDDKDFFSYTKEDLESYDCIVSNPPFSIKDKIIQRVYDLGKPFMLLFPQQTLQGKFRTSFFINYGMEYLGFDSRVCFYTKNELDSVKKSNHFASGYFCHNVLPEKLILEKLVLVNEPYGA